MRWTEYAVAAMAFNILGLLVVYALQRFQHWIPLLNPQDLAAVSPDSAFNTAVSFATNTNWQGYGGETTMSYLTQMLGLTVQNFVSAATGMAVLVALIRGFQRASASTIGNFWTDLVRTTLYILLPLSLVLAVALVSQGVVQTFEPYKTVELVQPVALRQPEDSMPPARRSRTRRAIRSPSRRRRRSRRSPWDPPRRRSRSSSSAPTAAASSTSTAPIRSRIRRRCRISSSCSRSS